MATRWLVGLWTSTRKIAPVAILLAACGSLSVKARPVLSALQQFGANRASTIYFVLVTGSIPY